MACSFDFSDIMEGGHVLLECVDEGSIEKVRSLLESQLCNVDETDQSGRTALHLAALRGKTDLANVLILGGADVNFRDKQGNTPLHWCGSIDTIELLVDSGASLYLRFVLYYWRSARLPPTPPTPPQPLGQDTSKSCLKVFWKCFILQCIDSLMNLKLLPFISCRTYINFTVSFVAADNGLKQMFIVFLLLWTYS